MKSLSSRQAGLSSERLLLIIVSLIAVGAITFAMWPKQKKSKNKAGSSEVQPDGTKKVKKAKKDKKNKDGTEKLSKAEKKAKKDKTKATVVNPVEPEKP